MSVDANNERSATTTTTTTTVSAQLTAASSQQASCCPPSPQWGRSTAAQQKGLLRVSCDKQYIQKQDTVHR